MDIDRQPTAKIYGAYYNAHTTLSVIGIGPEITVYSKANLFASACIGATQLSIEGPRDSWSSRVGFAGELAIGNEVWISEHWGVGMAAQVAYSQNKNPGENATFNTFWYGAALSMTWN